MGQHLFQHPWSCFFANLLPKNVCKLTRSVHDQWMHTYDWSTSILSIRGNYRTYLANTLPTNSDVRNYIGIFLNPSHLPPNFSLDHYTSYFQRGTFLSPPLLFDVIYSFDAMQLLYNFSHDYVILCNNFRDAIYCNLW